MLDFFSDGMMVSLQTYDFEEDVIYEYETASFQWLGNISFMLL